jgi:hypothetical protein
MEITGRDFKDTKRVAELINFVDQMDISSFDKESDVLYQKQPFFLSLILGYNFDINKAELGEVIKVIYIIWEYFKGHEKAMKIQVTKQQYERIMARNAHMLKYMEGEPMAKQKSATIGSDLDHLKSKALLTRIFFRFKTNKTLLGIQSEKAGIILIGMKTLIQCMEEIIYAPCDLKSPGD